MTETSAPSAPPVPAVEPVLDHCCACGKELWVHPEIAGLDLYCDDCPFPKPPCETCGKDDCDGECCNCEYCVKRRATQTAGECACPPDHPEAGELEDHKSDPRASSLDAQ